ncbi:MAG: thiamine-phosphate kinase [Methylohalobius sp. ZOD2]|nr:thiamine-phosphate kinase [Methylothermaceae bacterium]
MKCGPRKWPPPDDKNWLDRLDEFDLIRRFFTRSPLRGQTRLGVGDDAALLVAPAGQALAASVDTLVSGVHFFPDVDPVSLGHKALAVNLSDLAAMGAEPAWVLLALTMPEADSDWLEGFARGWFELAESYQIDLVGGDTTRGPLVITVQALGWIPEGKALRRSAARPGDWICVSGPLGDAGLGLKMLQEEVAWRDESAIERLLRPVPRVALGLALRELAHACIDISDGLAQDLGHVLSASGVGAIVDWSALPVSAAVRDYMEKTGDWRLPLCGGEDYELCFTVPPQKSTELERSLQKNNLTWHRIGTIEQQQGLRLRKGERLIDFSSAGYRHF